ncbi:MAG: hypothetical protein QXK12_08200 [Candidatus Nezhaarchaeales archaeon]
MGQRFKLGKRGIANVIGAVAFIFIAAFIVGNLMVWSMMRYGEYVKTVDRMLQLDEERRQEVIEVTDVYFGSYQTYANPDVYVVNGVPSGWIRNPTYPVTVTASQVTTYYYPVNNMYFATGSDGWTFSRKMPPGVEYGIYGDWTTDVRGGGSRSGAGFIYVDEKYDPPPGENATFQGNWTTWFSVDPRFLGLNPKAYLSCGRYVPYDLDFAAIVEAYVKIYFLDKDGVDRLLLVAEYTTHGDFQWKYNSFDVTSYIDMNTAKEYRVTVSVEVTVKHTGTPKEFLVFIDDVELSMPSESYAVDLYGSIVIQEEPTKVEKLELNVATHYNATLLQYVYLYDYSAESWVLLSRRYVSTDPSEFTFRVEGPSVPNYICVKPKVYPPQTVDPSPIGEVRVRVYAVLKDPFKAFIDSIGLSSFSVERDRVTLTITNKGHLTARLVSIWVISITNQTRFDVDIFLSPLQSRTLSLNYAWSYGRYLIKVVTERGSITPKLITVG